MMLSTAAVAQMSPVLTSDRDYLSHYAYALSIWAGKADATGHPAMAVRLRTRAYYLRTLAR